MNTPDDILSACHADVSAMSNEQVAAPHIAFQPCSLLAGQLNMINTSLRCQDNGRQMYIQCIHIVPLGCNECTS